MKLKKYGEKELKYLNDLHKLVGENFLREEDKTTRKYISMKLDEITKMKKFVEKVLTKYESK